MEKRFIRKRGGENKRENRKRRSCQRVLSKSFTTSSPLHKRAIKNKGFNYTAEESAHTVRAKYKQ